MLALVSIEDRVPPQHPLRTIKQLADEALVPLSAVFDEMYENSGRKSVPPERLLKAMLLIALFSVRSERQFCEQLDYNLMFRWFLDMDMTEPSFDHSTFSRNRGRLLEHEVASRFLAALVKQAGDRGLLSDDHFSVDGSLIQAWASTKSFRPKDEDDDRDSNGWSDFSGKKRSNETHESKTDPEAKLFRKGRGQPAKLSYTAHALTENRNGLVVAFTVTQATGRCEREAALALLDTHRPRGSRRRTLGADKGYDTRDFVADCRARRVTPHVAQNISGRRSAIDGRTTRHVGYGISLIVRRRIEEVFGWMKTVGGFRQTRFKGRRRTEFAGTIAAAAYNLIRLANLAPA
jgi:transposase